MKRHDRKSIPHIAAPLQGIEQHENGGYTIHGPAGTVTAYGVSLDAAWKNYKAEVEASNAAAELAKAGKPLMPADHVTKRVRMSRMIKKTERAAAELEAKAAKGASKA